jgi:hypothetical protein
MSVVGKRWAISGLLLMVVLSALIPGVILSTVTAVIIRPGPIRYHCPPGFIRVGFGCERFIIHCPMGWHLELGRCAWGDRWDHTVTFTLAVKDVTVGSPISDASVYIDGNYEGSTDSNGNLQVSTIFPPRDHFYSVTADDYQTMSGTLPIGPNSGGWFTVTLNPS